jgi:prephenate dehydrogenase
MKKAVCIIGLGLIGGSIGMAIKKKGLARVIGLTRERAKVLHAVKIKAVDYAGMNIKGMVQGADIIFICYPMHLIITELKKIIQFVKPGTIITDVGSTKELIVKQAEKIVPKGIFFVGGHPMAGKEQTGIDVAEQGLLEDKIYVLTKTKNTNIKALNALRSLILKVGAKVVVLDPAAHDKVVAGVSHMPIAVAASLVDSVNKSGKSKDLMIKLAASGFRDTTRIASGDPSLGTDMFTTNKKAVLDSISSFKKALGEIEKLIKGGKAGAISNKLAAIKSFRDSIYK